MPETCNYWKAEEAETVFDLCAELPLYQQELNVWLKVSVNGLGSYHDVIYRAVWDPFIYIFFIQLTVNPFHSSWFMTWLQWFML